jgi:hypothetical protein
VSSSDLTEILLANRRASLHDFMALSYGPARGLAYDLLRGFRAWVDCDDCRHGTNFCLVRCNAHKRVQALPTMPRHGVNTADAPLQERVKSRKNSIVFISVIGNPLKVDILLSRATNTIVLLVNLVFLSQPRRVLPFFLL